MSKGSYVSGKPSCPNHKCPLTDCENGIGICPISSCRFTYDGDEYAKTEKLRLNALGEHERVGDWKVQSIDGSNDG